MGSGSLWVVFPHGVLAVFNRKEISRLDFRRLPGPVLILPEEMRDECGLIFPNSGW